jgi:hypothetical protein
MLTCYNLKPQGWYSQRFQRGERLGEGWEEKEEKAVIGGVVVEGTRHMGGHVFSGVPGVKSRRYHVGVGDFNENIVDVTE